MDTTNKGTVCLSSNTTSVAASVGDNNTLHPSHLPRLNFLISAQQLDPQGQTTRKSINQPAPATTQSLPLQHEGLRSPAATLTGAQGQW
jgi:hypothetical protein